MAILAEQSRAGGRLSPPLADSRCVSITALISIMKLVITTHTESCRASVKAPGASEVFAIQIGRGEAVTSADLRAHGYAANGLAS